MMPSSAPKTSVNMKSGKTPRAKPYTPKRWPSWMGGLESAAASVRGKYHAVNEDSYLTMLQNFSVICVADGVGSGENGKVASESLLTQVETLTYETFHKKNALTEWLSQADDFLCGALAKLSDRPGAATFVAAFPTLRGRLWHLTWAGDCRAYKVSSNFRVTQVTQDDTYGNLIETPPPGGKLDDPARMVGNGAIDRANSATTFLYSRQYLLLCSDGVHNFVHQDEIGKILKYTECLEAAAKKMVSCAHLNGGHDDATVVLVHRHCWFGLADLVWCFALLAGILLLLGIHAGFVVSINQYIDFILGISI